MQVGVAKGETCRILNTRCVRSMSKKKVQLLLIHHAWQEQNDSKSVLTVILIELAECTPVVICDCMSCT